MIHLSKLPVTLHKVLGSMSQGLTNNLPGIWGFGACWGSVLLYTCRPAGAFGCGQGEATSLLRNLGFTVTTSVSIGTIGAKQVMACITHKKSRSTRRLWSGDRQIKSQRYRIERTAARQSHGMGPNFVPSNRYYK